MSDSTVMSRARWVRIQELFDGASAMPVAERAAWLDAECRGVRALRDQVAALLEAGNDADPQFEDRVEQAIAGALVDLDAVAPGRIIGRYRVLRLLGRGGMGAVYLS